MCSTHPLLGARETSRRGARPLEGLPAAALRVAALAAPFVGLVLLAVTRATGAAPADSIVGPLQDLPWVVQTRSLDGSGNNIANPGWGAAGAAFVRLAPNDYGDGAGSPAGQVRPNPREISNRVTAVAGIVLDDAPASDLFWQWGQFLDHDLTLTPAIEPTEPFDIAMPPGDPYFDPDGAGSKTMPMNRSSYRVVDGVRQQLNFNTAYIDASQVYGSNASRAAALRTGVGGRLATSSGDLLPFNVNGLANSPSADPFFFLAGDVRANEQVGLIALHTLFVREHNYWADVIHRDARSWSDEQIYQGARLLVGAEMQAITYREFLPLLLGPDALSPYSGYRPEVNAGIANEFATAAFRFGHSMVSPVLQRLDGDGVAIAAGGVPVREAFFNPPQIVEFGIDSLLRGLASQRAQRLDVSLIDDLRNFLFGSPGSGGFDLAALNVQRGRDHGVPSYNEMRRSLGLRAATAFADVSGDPDVQARLRSVYVSVEDIDLWIGALAEEHVSGARVGETMFAILKDQFERLRDGDRFWYESHLPRALVNLVERQTLAEIIRRNGSIGRELQNEVFIVRPNRRPGP